MNWWHKIKGSKKEYPPFWEAYAASFQERPSSRVVVLDCETTGLDVQEDKILSIGAVALKDGVIYVEDHFSRYLQQPFIKAASIPIHGIVASSHQALVTEAEALQDLLAYIRNANIIGHHIQFDIQIINQALHQMKLPTLKNKIQDTADLYLKYKGIPHRIETSLDELCKEFKIVKKDRHTALGDAFLTAQVYQRMLIQ